MQIDDDVYAAFCGPLLQWYRTNRRNLPWRRRQDDPYAVWVSEIMLQQTQVVTVIPYYNRWMERFPTLELLALAPQEEVLKYWAGLGYYARARNLHLAAQTILAKFDGVFPVIPAQIEALPGIGRYTAGAIRSIALEEPAPIVDANVMRVLSRVFAIDGDPKSGAVQSNLWALAEALIPERQARDFNQAVMELGALICSPSDPACERCPLLAVCRAGNSPNPTAWPQIPAGKSTLRVTHCSVAISEGDRVLLVRRPPHGLWGGLWEFPRQVCGSGESPADCSKRAAREVVGLTVESGHRIATVKHSVTHHAITLHLFEGMAERNEHPTPLECAEIRNVTAADLNGLPFSAPQRLLADAWIHARERRARGGEQQRLF